MLHPGHYCQENTGKPRKPLCIKSRSPEQVGEQRGWSGRPVSNRRPTAWEAVALPTELRPHNQYQ